MNDVNDHIREKLKQAREEANLSQRELAEIMNSAQGTISDLERGRIRINAAELARYAQALNKPISYFFPVVQESNLTEREQILLGFFRRLSDRWQKSILDQVKAQLALYEMTAEADQVTEEISKLPEEQREDAAFRTAYRWLKPLLQIGLRIYIDDEGNTSIGHRNLPGLRLPFPYEDEKDRRIALELQRRYDLDGSKGKEQPREDM